MRGKRAPRQSETCSESVQCRCGASHLCSLTFAELLLSSLPLEFVLKEKILTFDLSEVLTMLVFFFNLFQC